MKKPPQEMNRRDFNGFCLLVSTLVIALAMLLVPAAMASSFSADLSVAVVAKLPAGVNPGQSAPANLIPGCISLSIGNASAACNFPTSTLIIAAGQSTLTFTAGTASGSAGPPFGYAFANSFGTSITESFTNTNAFAVLVPIGIGYVPDLEVTAGPGESSDAAFAFSIGGLGQGVHLGASKNLPCNACGADSYNPGALGASFLLNVPALGSRDIVIDPYALGSAGVPEPSSLLLLGSGVTGLAGFLRKRLLTRS